MAEIIETPVRVTAESKDHVFDSLSSKLQNAFRNLHGNRQEKSPKITSADSLREVRMALLEADVNFKVARDFIERVKNKAIGAEVVQSVQPGQQIIKIIHDELVDLLGSQNASLNLGGSPTSILMVGLHGSGKTTSSGKLARLLQKQRRQPVARGGGRLSSGSHGPVGNARQTN